MVYFIETGLIVVFQVTAAPLSDLKKCLSNQSFYCVCCLFVCFTAAMLSCYRSC